MPRETCIRDRLGSRDAPVLAHVAPDLAQLYVSMGPVHPLHMRRMASQMSEIMQQLQALQLDVLSR